MKEMRLRFYETMKERGNENDSCNLRIWKVI